MFGSNFNQNFGIPEMQDPAAMVVQPQQPGQPMATGLPAAPQMPGIGSPSPMGGGVLSPGAGATPQMPGNPVDSTQGTAPAAGISSPFGRPAL